MKRVIGFGILAAGIAGYVASMFLTVSAGQNLRGWQCFLVAFDSLPDLLTSGDWPEKALVILCDVANAGTLLCLLPLGAQVQKVVAMAVMTTAPTAVLWLFFAPDAKTAFSAAPVLWGAGMIVTALGVVMIVDLDSG